MKDNQLFWDLYKEYLKSKEWMEKRNKVLVRDGGMCQGCLEVKAVQVHHKSYDRVFDEPLFDLVSLCKKCHDKIHDGTTWQERGMPFTTRKTVEYKGSIGIITEYKDVDIAVVRFRDGEEGCFMTDELVYRD